MTSKTLAKVTSVISEQIEEKWKVEELKTTTLNISGNFAVKSPRLEGK